MKKRPILRLDLERIKRGRSVETNFQKHLRNVVKSIEKRQKGSLSPFSVGKNTQRSISEIHSQNTINLQSSRSNNDEIRVKRSLAKILKSTNLISYKQELENSNERKSSSKFVSILRKYSDSTRKNLAKTFSVKTERASENPVEIEEIKNENFVNQTEKMLNFTEKIELSNLKNEQQFVNENSEKIQEILYKSEPKIHEIPKNQENNSKNEEFIIEQINSLQKLSFFKNYLESKYFGIWKQTAMYFYRLYISKIEIYHLIGKKKILQKVFPLRIPYFLYVIMI